MGMLSRWKPPLSCDDQLILKVRIEPCRPFWRSRPLLTRNASRENSSGRLSRPGTATLCFMAALRAQDDLEDVLKAVLRILLERRRNELRQRQETGFACLQISRHQDGVIEPGDLKQLLPECVEGTEIRMIIGQREARAPLAEHLEAMPQQQVGRLASRRVRVATELGQRVRELVVVVAYARQRRPAIVIEIGG